MVSLIEGIEIGGDLPVIYARPIDAVILSDVHIGYEEEMASKGLFLPRVQKKRFMRIYRQAIENFKTNKLIINGDMKHRFNGLGRQEKEDLTEVFKDLKEFGVSVTLVKGNHDNYISLVAEKFDNVEMVEEVRNGNLIISHGHKDVEVEHERVYIIGHEHPRIAIRDKLGFSRKFPCFLVTPTDQGGHIVVLPAVGSYQAGNDVSLMRNSYMSTLMREHSVLERARPFLIVEGEGIMEFPELRLLKDVII